MKQQQRWLKGTELLLLVLGVSCLFYLSDVHLEARASERAADLLLMRSPQRSQDGETRIKVDPGPGDSATGTAATADVIGRMEIRQLGLSVPVLSDYETKSLLHGVGHVPGTVGFGGLGNVGIAGHRDTYFRPLRRIQPRMDIRLADASGVYHYQVDTTEIVKPEQVEVLDVRSRPELTIITCYPFNFIGAAPLRFIIHAHLMSVIPDKS